MGAMVGAVLGALEGFLVRDIVGRLLTGIFRLMKVEGLEDGCPVG